MGEVIAVESALQALMSNSKPKVAVMTKPKTSCSCVAAPPTYSRQEPNFLAAPQAIKVIVCSCTGAYGRIFQRVLSLMSPQTGRKRLQSGPALIKSRR